MVCAVFYNRLELGSLSQMTHQTSHTVVIANV